MNFKAIILAAGKGTRMKSKYPKVAHKICGKPMLNHVIDRTKESGVDDVVLILGHESDYVKEILTHECKIVEQKEQLGTGHAVLQAIDNIDDEDVILVICGDTPLIKAETLKNLFDYHVKNEYKTTVLTTTIENPFGYGRIIRDDKNDLHKIVEQKDANEQEKLVKEINSGIYCFDGKSLKESLLMINNDNAQGEYYLTDTVKIMRDKNLKVGAFEGSSIEELMGVNSRVELAKAESIMRNEINKKHMINGVTIIDPDNTYIEADVKIGFDSIIYPGVMLLGDTEIGEDTIIGHNSNISNSQIGNNTEIMSSKIVDSKVGNNTKVGPFAYLRPNSDIGNDVKIGDFVEVKKSKIGNGSKASHLAYIGDAEVGENVNIGCGVVFVNYDGKNKFKSIVKDGAFVGSNSNLVAPVIVEENGYIAAGSTITHNVPDGSLAIGRARQVLKENWVYKKNKK
ncbi:MAG: bifunctional UDP-N-acetylglucosamine diphosphorylase/glucosamine-1-phosphate N-acetyltransferase GlmU [Clostridioides sp.]|jgi:bifunctional UDP-N-acetylglucosamine pyrophosphorylase/glucosamine-1-phosphate N-acetyltransferase|nr:bifunctional UDP-N-acetylglucosamine diphosphorylase/glucosamine-1-phosphate N-acetyltransferase GlmU [Clostridioides sp.]